MYFIHLIRGGVHKYTTFRCGELFDATEVPKHEVGFVDEECVLFELRYRKAGSRKRGTGDDEEEKEEKKKKKKEKNKEKKKENKKEKT